MEINKLNDHIIVNQILSLEEYFSIEDYATLIAIQTCLGRTRRLDLFTSPSIKLNEDEKITNTTIKVNFLIDGKTKEILMEKNMLKKIYAFCKIYSEHDKSIKVLMLRAENYDPNSILKRINEIRFFKGAFKNYLNIDEFPIKNYYLEEKKLLLNIGNNIDNTKMKGTENYQQDIEKEFILKKINNNQNNINQKDNSNIFDLNSSEAMANLNKVNLANINNNTNPYINNNNINNGNKNNNNNVQANFRTTQLKIRILFQMF